MRKFIALATAGAIALTAGQAAAQSSSDPRATIGSIFSAIFGDRVGTTTSIEAQWAAGQTPLATQRAQFESRVDSEVRAGNLTQSAGARLKTDYYALVQLESRYGADRRFTSTERNDLADRYGALTQVLADGGYSDGGITTASVAAGRAEFDQRVDAAVAARRITRAEARRLKNEYATVAGVEAGYLGDGVLSARERNDLEVRLDALDARVGDAAYAALTPAQRLDAISRALASNRLSTAQRAQMQVEYQDLVRLEAAYARLNETADEKAYLERRLAELETRARVGFGANAF